MDLNRAIQRGVTQGKQQKTKKKKKRILRPVVSGLAVAALLLLFVSTIRSSPAFADAVSAFPGMKKIVALIEDDHGLKAAIRNEHFQKIGVSDETSGIHITLDGVIPSDQNLVLFYTISHKPNHQSDFLQDVQIRAASGHDLALSSTWHNTAEDFETAKQSTNSISMTFDKPLTDSEFILEFEYIDGYGQHETIELPFTVDLTSAPTYTYALDQKVTIEQQSFVVQQVTINPVITTVEIEFDPANTKEIFGINELVMTGNWGKKWAPLTNGITASSTDDFPNRVTYFLQSSYFEKGKNLKLQIDHVMALDKNETEFVVDTETETILQQPTDERFSNMRIKNGEMRFDFKGEDDFYQQPLSLEFEDAKQTLYEFEYWGGSINGEREAEVMMKLPDTSFENPITIQINGYPSYLQQKKPVSIEIK